MKNKDSTSEILKEVEDILARIKGEVWDTDEAFGDECLEWAKGGVDGITEDVVEKIEIFIDMIDEYGGDGEKVYYALALLARSTMFMDGETKIKIITSASTLLGLNPVVIEEDE